MARRQPEFLKRSFPLGMTLPYAAGYDMLRARIEAAYREHMGREFDAGNPNPCDFGSPMSPDSKYHADAPEWRSYFAAHDAWRGSDEHAAYLAACAVALARIEQFTYSPRKRNRAAVLAGAARA